jgi:hypothetical protein
MQQSQKNIMLTSAEATATFPLLAPDTFTGVDRSVVVLSPTCVKNIIISPTRTFPVTHNSPLKTNNKNHLAINVRSPAEYCASTRKCTRVKLRISR